MKKRREIPIANIIVALMFIIGAGVFLYPTVSNYFFKKNSSYVTEQYAAKISSLTQEEISVEMQKAIEYNEALVGEPVRDPFIDGSGIALPENYIEVLDLDGVICTIEIPKIDVKLPVKHGTGDEVLQTAVGHLRQTALPIGGKGNNPVLSGHTGLANARIFTDLTELEKGDFVIINILDEVHYYKVDKIYIILPEDVKNLNPDPDRDLLTLLTCTPYGINSHRLVVQCERYYPENSAEIKQIIKPNVSPIIKAVKEYKSVVVVVFFFVAFIIVWIVFTVVERRRKLKKSKEE